MNQDRFKFRAWHKTAEVMLQPGDAHGTRTHADPYRYWAEGQDVLLMQSTGLRDKNGVLIFEGDVIMATPDDDDDETIRHVVKYENDGYWIEVPHHDFDLSSLSYASTECPWYEYEVIGNIYENPELVES